MDFNGDKGAVGLSCLVRTVPCTNEWLYLQMSVDSGGADLFFVDDISLSIVLFLPECLLPFSPFLPAPVFATAENHPKCT